MLLWLDDRRPAPAGWTRVHSVREAIEAMSTGTVTHASLDHDLGDYAPDGGDGARLTDWMAAEGCWPTGLRIHSSNGVGIDTMLRTIDTYGPYYRAAIPQRGVAPHGGWPSAATC